MLYLEKKYAALLSNSLSVHRLTSTQPYSARFRCPYCGDSKKSKFKTRGYLYEKDHHLHYKCFNCEVAHTFKSFLKFVSPSLYQEYVIETIAEKNAPKKDIPSLTYSTKAKLSEQAATQGLKKVSQLAFNHPAKRYVDGRMIPSKTHYRVFYTDKFMTWVNTFVPGKFSDAALKHDHPRLVLLFKDMEGNIFGAQGRDLRPDSSLRYLTIMFNDDHTKIFGLETIDVSKLVNVVEGPIDSLFVDNCLAMAGSDANLKNLLPSVSYRIIMDNERRSVQIVNRIDKYISQGHKVVIWPQKIKQKDINDMVLSGLSTSDISRILDSNTYSGLSAKLKLGEWSIT